MPVARTCRELLPRVFTLVPMFHRDGLFSVALSVSTVFSRRTFPLGSMALCVVPTFLIRPDSYQDRRDKTGRCCCKSTNYQGINGMEVLVN